MPVLYNQKKETRIALCIDSSGSMGSFSVKSIVGCVNNLISSIAKEAPDDQFVKVCLFDFGANVTQLSPLQPADRVNMLSAKSYTPVGSTPMMECIWKAYLEISHGATPDTALVVTVITDGDATDDTSYGNFAHLVRELVSNKVGKKGSNLSITVAVPTEFHKSRLLARLPVGEGNVSVWDSDMERATQEAATGFSNFLRQRSQTGAASTTGFYATVDKAKEKAIKKSLDDVQDHFFSWNVRAQDPKVLQSFVESRKRTFEKGKAFYQLTKPELVQAHKQILLKSLANGKVYGGDEARGILGLPNADTKVKPSEQSDWEIFVQSTSTNRKLMPGTKVMYLK